MLERIRTKTEPEETSFIVRLLFKVAQTSFNNYKTLLYEKD